MREIEPEDRFLPEEATNLDFPSFSIGLKHLPEAEKWKIGEEYEVAFKLKLKRISKEERDGEKSEGSIGFDTVGIDVERDDVIVEKKDEGGEEKSEGSYRSR